MICTFLKDMLDAHACLRRMFFHHELSARRTQTTDVNRLNILLIGSAGHGKSATGNSILGRNVFKTSQDFKSETKFLSDATVRYRSCEIQVIDGPGLEDRDLDATQNKKQLFENMDKVLRHCDQEMPVFLLVIKFGLGCTEEDRKAICELKQIFGENYLQNRGIIVITGGDCFSRQMKADGTPWKPFTEWCLDQDKVLGDLIEECSHRVVLFNNLSKHEEEQIRQRNELLFQARHLQKAFRSSPTCRMAQTTDIIPLNILLIGKTGHGRSATGNSILGRKAFITTANVKSETQVVIDAWAEHGPYEVKVVDGPGLVKTDLDAVGNKKQACENMATSLMMCNGGIHAFVLVIRFGIKYTEEERRTISDLKQIFGDDYLKDRGIIVITGGDCFSRQMKADDTPKPFTEWCREQDKDLGNLITECGHRVVLFNNLSESEEEQTRQRKELLSHVVQLQKIKGVYTTEHFQAFAQVRDKFIKDKKQTILEEEIQKRIDLLSAEIKRLSKHRSLEYVDKVEDRITDVYMTIGKKNLQEESLQPLIGCLKRLSTTTEELRRAIRWKNRTAIKSNLEILLQHKEELDKTRKIPWRYIAAGFGVGFACGIGVTAAGAAIVSSGGSLALGACALGKFLLGAAATYLGNKLLQL